MPLRGPRRAFERAGPCGFGLAVLMLFWPGPQPAAWAQGAGSSSSPTASSAGNLFGDVGGARPWLGARGISIGLTETGELLANLTGGVHTGPAYDGLTQLNVGVDTGKSFGWSGGTVNVSAFWIHGRSISSDNLDNLQTASGIEAERAFRLWEAWFDQKLAGGAIDIKVGQQSLDQEFITDAYTALFVNTMMGWPVLPSYDMYAGGPAYPLASLGARVRGSAGPFTGLLGVFDDNPAGGAFANDDQLRGPERTGVDFDLATGALVIGELQYALNPAPSDPKASSPGASSPGLAGTYRIGGWFDSGGFPDQRTDEAGRSLADPASDGNARLRRGNYSAYFSGDQAVWQQKGTPRTVGVFARLMGAPADRNLIRFSSNLVLSIKAPLLSRPDDSLGIGYGLAKVSGRASALDRDRRVLAGDAAYPIRSSESFIELTYQAQLTPWWTLQPDLQYVFMPGAGVPDPGNPGSASTSRIGNETILDLRTNVVF